MPGTTMKTERRYDIDALRVFAFGLLILYHVAMFYVEDWGWHVKSSYEAGWLQFPMLLVNQWRMSLLFIISGLAVSFVWQRYTPGRFAMRRLYRLLLPLLFGMAFIVSPQCYYEALGKGLIEPGYGRFMLQYLTFQDFPGDAWGGEEMIVWTWNHLWYLAYVLFYSLLLIPVAVLLDGPLRHVRSGFLALRGIFIFAVPVAVLMLYGAFIYPKFPRMTGALVDDWYAHAMYGTFFLIGYLIGRDEGFWRELERMRWVTAISALVFFALFMTRDLLLPADSFAFADNVRAFIIYGNRWLWIIAIFGWGHRLLNRPSRWLSYATGAVYPWYILHQTVIIVIGVHLAGYSLGPVVEPILVLGGTLGTCYVLYEFVIRRSRILQPLFGVSVGR
jgi:membrane-bound acyltransferase YfiQ involved in biofilm formation